MTCDSAKFDFTVTELMDLEREEILENDLEKWIEKPDHLDPWEEVAVAALGWPERARAPVGDYGLVREGSHWQLWPIKFKPFKPFALNFLDPNFLRRLKSFGASSPLAKAMGRSVHPGQTLLDASAGLLQDALFLARWGLKVTALERNPAVYLLVRSALENALKSSIFTELIRGELKYELSSSQQSLGVWDLVYYDPMYPTKKALSDKSMQILKDLVGADEDSRAVAEQLRAKAKTRLVVKRPPKGEALWEPDYSISSKTVRFDVYLSKGG